MTQETISEKILLPIPSTKVEKVTTESPIFKLYLRDNYSNFTFVEKTIKENESKIIYILDKINKKSNLEKLIISAYLILFRPFLKVGTSNATILKNLNTFLTLQFSVKRFETLLSIIEIQHVFLSNFYSTFTPLLNTDNLSYMSQELVSGSNLYFEDKVISNLLRKCFNNYNIRYISKHQVNHELDTDDNIVILRTIFNSLIRKFQKLENIDIRTYGSYCSYLIDSKVEYNDIDIYLKHPLGVLTPFIVMSKIFLNINTDIDIIPYIPGHTSLTYRKKHYADCLFIDGENMGQIPYITIKEVKCIHPVLQIVNFFRSLSELRRVSDISNNKENTVKKISALLQYICNVYKIDLSKDLVETTLDFESIDNGYVLNLKPLFEKIKDYDNVKDSLNFDYLVLSNLTCEMFFRFIKNTIKYNPAIRKQWGALFNEVVVEYTNKNEDYKPVEKKTRQRRVTVEEKDLSIKRVIEDDNSKLSTLIQSNNILLMSQFTTNFYYKTTFDNTGKVVKIEMSNISKETTLSSFVLSQILTSFDNKPLVRFYLRLLLSYVLQDNDKENELSLLAKKSDTCLMSLIKKHKLSGLHKTLTLGPDTIRYRRQFFYKEQEKNIYTDIQEFLDICIYNN